MIKFSTLCLFLALCIPVFAQHYDAEVLYANTSIEVDRGSLIKNITYEIRINNRGGERFTQVEIPYSSLNKLSKIDAYIKDAGGRVVKKLKKSDLTTRSSISDFSLYEDESVQSFTLKHNTYPYTIVYSYQIKQSDFLYLTYWMPVIHQGVPTLAADLHVSVPRDYRLSFQNQQVTPKFFFYFTDNLPFFRQTLKQTMDFIFTTAFKVKFYSITLSAGAHSTHVRCHYYKIFIS